jgi:hypothetical protein
MRSCSASLVGRGDRDQLDLVELVLADHAAGVAAAADPASERKLGVRAVIRSGSSASSVICSRTMLVRETSAVGISQ